MRFAEIEALLVAELDDTRAALETIAGSAQLELGAELLAAIDIRWVEIGLGSEGFARLKHFIALMPAKERRLTSGLWTACA